MQRAPYRPNRTPGHAPRTPFQTITLKVRVDDIEGIGMAKAAAKACGVSDADLLRAAYADALRKYRAILESQGRWESILADHIADREARAKGTKSANKVSLNGTTTAPNPRPPQVFEG